jgi:hypothetical protein
VAASVVAGWHDRAASCYLRLGAPWWQDRLERGAAGSGARRRARSLTCAASGGWIVGFDQATFSLPTRGLCYLSDCWPPGADGFAASQLAAAAWVMPDRHYRAGHAAR